MNAQLSRGNYGDVFGDVMTHTCGLTLQKKLRFYCCSTQGEPLNHRFTQQVLPS